MLCELKTKKYEIYLIKKLKSYSNLNLFEIKYFFVISEVWKQLAAEAALERAR